MGNNTAEAPAASTEEEQPEVIEPTESEEQPQEGAETGEEGEEQQEATEVEIVLDGADGSQPDTQHGIRKRINKLNNKVAKAEGTAADNAHDLDVEREKNKLLRLALEQKAPAEAAVPPDPMDFDGVADPKYVAALNEYNKPLIAAEVQRQTANLTPVQTETVDPGLVKKQTKHYERAEELGAKDFDEVEDKAISILGNETVNHLINNSDESHLVLYYLGKNPEKAEEITKLIEANPIKGVLQLGRLSAKLSVKPKANSEPTPDPDEELQGGSPSAGRTNKHQRAVDAARTKAQESGNISLVLTAKKAALDAGVTVT